MPENENPEEYREKALNGFGGKDEIDLLELWKVIWKRRILIVVIVGAMVAMTIVASLCMTNIYRAEAVITPVETKSGGGGMAAALMQQMGGGLGSLIGLPQSSSSTEIKLLLESNVLRKKIIHDYNLLHVLFSKQWDDEKKAWKKKEVSLNPVAWISKLVAALRPVDKKVIKKSPGIPDELDGLRKLEKMVNINRDIKDNYITISVQFDDPDMAAAMVGYFLAALNNHMSLEAKRVATINKKYLEEQLSQTTDPLIQQKLYNMIAQQIETSMMAAVKENFAFKIIDPPIVPDRKIKPKRAQMVVLSFFFACFLAVLVAFFLEYLEKHNINIKLLRKK